MARNSRSDLFVAIGLLVAFVLIATPARADEPSPPQDELRYDGVIDGAVTVGAGVLWIASEVLKPYLAPATCRWCARDAEGQDTLNAVDASVREAIRWRNTRAAATWSNVVGYAVTPMAAIGLNVVSAAHDRRRNGIGVDTLVVLEAAIVGATINQLGKLVAGRQRPFVHARVAEDPRAPDTGPDENLSFFSGHTTLAFALATASGTVASMRGYRLAPMVWATGLTLATTTGYLRIAADRHYFTDVVVGAIVGSAVGVGLPYLFHRPSADTTSVPPVTSAPPAGGAASTGAAPTLTFGGAF